MQTFGQGLKGMGLLLDLNRDRLVFPLAVCLALALAALVAAELMHPVVPIDSFVP